MMGKRPGRWSGARSLSKREQKVVDGDEESMSEEEVETRFDEKKKEMEDTLQKRLVGEVRKFAAWG